MIQYYPSRPGNPRERRSVFFEHGTGRRLQDQGYMGSSESAMERKEGMERTGWQQSWVRILTTLLTLFMMGFIFFMSTEDAEKSDQTSGVISKQVTVVVYPDYETYSPAKKVRVFNGVQHVVRKVAHFSEYMMLGFCLRLCLESWFGLRFRGKKTLYLLAWLGGTLYAVTDELHQLAIDGRSGQWTDVLIDSGGVLTGVLISALVITLIGRRIGERQTGEAEESAAGSIG